MSDSKELIQSAIKEIMSAMNFNCQANIEEGSVNGKQVLNVSIQAPEDARVLIGKSGQNLQALEHIIRAIALKDKSDTTLISVDINDYKKSRASHVVELARQAVMRVRNTRRAEALAPMSSYERRVVHMELASISDIATESVGQEPQRRIIIKPYSL